MRRLESGERERHLRAEDVRNLRPRAVLGQPRRPLSSRPGPTTVKGIKAKMPRWRAERRGVHRMHLIVRSNPDTPPGAIRALRLVGAPSPSISRETEERNAGDPLAQSMRTGSDILLTPYMESLLQPPQSEEPLKLLTNEIAARHARAIS